MNRFNHISNAFDDELRTLYTLIGQRMPSLDLVGKDFEQLPLEV